MKIIETVEAARAHVGNRKVPSVLVPTMGALHLGHLELIRAARDYARAEGEVVVSIFINPLQFERASDLQKYPRTKKEDEKICREAGVNVLFRPKASEMYSADRSVAVEETVLANGLCGPSRPGHFRGVCTVVCKLFNLMAPAAAIFGEKDYQQLAIIRRMVRDLNFPVQILAVPTVRESDGLALSSRNRLLTMEERQQAAVLYRAAATAKKLAERAETRTANLVKSARDVIASAKDARVDYIEVIDGETLVPLGTVRPNARIALAVFIGTTRLIDNLPIA